MSAETYARVQRIHRSDAIAMAIAAVICIASSATFYVLGGPTRGWNAMLFLVSLGAWALLCIGAFELTSGALLRLEPDWPERFEGAVVPPNPAVARFWRNALSIAAPMTLALLAALAYLLAIHTRANDAPLAGIMVPTLFVFLAAILICAESWMMYRMASRGYTVESDEWSDGNGYTVDGI